MISIGSRVINNLMLISLKFTFITTKTDEKKRNKIKMMPTTI